MTRRFMPPDKVMIKSALRSQSARSRSNFSMYAGLGPTPNNSRL